MILSRFTFLAWILSKYQQRCSGALAMLATLVVLALAQASPSFAAAPEHEVKAAFIYNFAKFTTWPGESFEDETGELRLCTMDMGRIGSSLQAYQGELVGDKKLVVMEGRQENVEQCHLLVIGELRGNSLRGVLERVQKLPVLTVGDQTGFIEAGGIINITVSSSKKVGFEINPEAATDANLSLSSHLLSLAKIKTRRN